MTTRREWYCNLCRDGIASSNKTTNDVLCRDGIGITFKDNGHKIIEREIHQVENHLCVRCIKSISDLCARMGR